jgi:hypothetical protein
MYSELLQLVGVSVVFAVALLLWLWIVYLPRRTLESWEGQRISPRSKPQKPNSSDDRNS